MKSRTLYTLVSLVLITPCTQAGSIDKAKLRRLAELPKVEVSFSINYSTTLGFYFNGNKPDPLAEIARIRKQLKGDASDAERYLRIDWLYSKAGREKESNAANAKAIALCRQQLREHPDDQRCLALLGQALVRSGNTKEGETLLRRAVKEAPKEWRAWLALAEYTDILALRAILGDKYFSWHSIGDRILSSSLLDKKPTAEQIATMRRLWGEAGRYYARAIELAPRETEPYFHRIGSNWTHSIVEAALGARKGKHANILGSFATPQCAADMERIARLSPDDPKRVGMALLMAILAGMQQQKEKTIGDFKSVEEFLAEKRRSLLNKLPAENGKTARWCIECLEQLASNLDQTTAADAAEFLANVLMVMKRFDDDSPKGMGEMSGMGGTPPLLGENSRTYGMGEMGGMGGTPPAAAEDRYTARILKYLRRTVQVDPSRESAWELLTGLLVESKETRDALEVGHDRVKIKDNAHNRFLLAKIYAEDHQWQAAAKHLHVAVKNDPNDLDSRCALAAVLLRRDDAAALKEAGEHLDIAGPLVKKANRKASTVNFLLLRGIHAGLSDHRKQAKESFRQALRSDKDEKNAARAIAALGEPLTPDDRQLAIDCLFTREVNIKRPDAAVTEVSLFDDITDDDLFFLTAFPHLRELSLRSESITDSGLAYVEGLTTLRALTLGYSKITDKGLARLRSLANLRSLDLETSMITAAGLAHLEAFQKLERLVLPALFGLKDKGEASSQEGLAQLSKLPNLRDLSVPVSAAMPVSAAITDKDLAQLTALPHLEKLKIPRSKITDKGMSLLGHCIRLRTLEVSSESITDAGMAHLKELRHLRELRLGRTKITGAGLAPLKGLTELEILDLSDSAVTDAGLANLSGLTHLRELDLSDRGSAFDAIFAESFRELDKLAGKTTPPKKPAKPKITDAGLKHLQGLTKLTDLDLCGRPITDSGITQLGELKSLQRLNVGSTKVTRQGVAQLRKALPKLEVSR